MIVENCGG